MRNKKETTTIGGLDNPNYSKYVAGRGDIDIVGNITMEKDVTDELNKTSRPEYSDRTSLLHNGASTGISLPLRIRMYIYVSHFLSAWGNRMWAFGVGLFLVVIAPDSLRLTAIYGLSMGGSVLLFGPLIGDWVDKTPRLSAARTSLVVQNISIIICAIVVYVVITYFDDIQRVWPNEGLLTLSYGVIILITIVSILASTTNTIAVERDWIVVICEKDTDMLAATSATLKSIDLITNMVAPILTGQIMTYASIGIGALFIAAWNFVSLFVEYFLLWKVYNVVPALRAKKDLSRIQKETKEDTNASYQSNKLDVHDTTESRDEIDIEFELSKEYLGTPLSVRKNENNAVVKHETCLRKIFAGIIILGRGWKTYMKYDVALAGLALSTLYMTVLGFDNVTVGFAYTQGINESVMGILMAAGGAVGILGAAIYPCLRKRIGLVRTGIFGVFFQVMLLSLCVLSIWAPGSPFDPFFLTKGSKPVTHFNTDINSTTNMYFNTNINLTDQSVTVQTLSFEYDIISNTTDNLSNSDVIEEMTSSWLQNVSMNISGDDVTNSYDVVDETITAYISIILLMTGIIGARCGLWMADLTISQIFLETIVESERGIVLGVQTSLNQLMDMLKFGLVVVLPQPEIFGFLILISYAFICIGWVLYARFTYKARGHLFHFSKLKCVDSTKNNNNE